MYQYVGKLKSNKEIIAEGHSVEDIEKQVKHYRREQKRGIHTNMNVEVEVIHIKRDQVHGDKKEEIIKII